MIPEIEKLIENAFSAGVPSEKVKEIFLKKLGIDSDEFELFLEKRSSQEFTKRDLPKNYDVDSFDISDQELIIRVNKWVNLVTEDSYNGKIERFPDMKQRQDKSVLDNGKEIGLDILKAVSANFKSTLSLSNPLNYVRMVNQITNGESPKKVNHQEIVDLANGYLLILEYRSSSNTILESKFLEYSNTLKAKLNLYNEKQAKKWFKKIF